VEGMTLAQGVHLAIAALGRSAPAGPPNGAAGPREVPLTQLEVALLQRDRPRRTFRRIGPDRLRELADG
jgi:proteasome alpha subunit